jgi:hypothetical protein
LELKEVIDLKYAAFELFREIAMLGDVAPAIAVPPGVLCPWVLSPAVLKVVADLDNSPSAVCCGGESRGGR